jgi:hypothetical protein
VIGCNQFDNENLAIPEPETHADLVTEMEVRAALDSLKSGKASSDILVAKLLNQKGQGQ